MTVHHRVANGFTLIEVMVALMIGGMALAGAAALLSGLAERAEAIRTAAARVDREANAERVLRSLLANLELSPDTSPSWVGDPRSARFRAWCDTPAGWPGRCAVRLFFQDSGGVGSLRLELIGAEPSVTELRRGFRAGHFRYLVNAGQGGQWTTRWSHPVPPAAVAVITGNDTLLLTVWGGG
ncbi:MAG: PulJ/GspJ family protein [Candidatus Rokuibacteriota bacterium]